MYFILWICHIVFGHIFNQGTQKGSLIKKGLQRTILDFYYS
jgi:hypothetical protein